MNTPSNTNETVTVKALDLTYSIQEDMMQVKPLLP